MVDFVIRRKTFVSMLFIGLTLLGYVSYRNLPVDLLPNIELPFLIVQVTGMREMDPSYMEKQAIIPLESAVGMLEGIDEIESSADRRQGRIIIFYNSDVNIKYAYLRLQEQVDAVKSSLPEEFRVMVLKFDTQQLSNLFMNLQVRGFGGTDRIRNIVDKKIVDKLESIDGIVNVEVFGGREKSVEVILNNEAIESHGISPSTIRNLIVSNNQYKDHLGQIHQQNKRFFINLVAEYTAISDLENIVIDRDIPLLLKDVATIQQGIKEETSISRINGKEAVTIQLIRDTQVNLIQLSDITHEMIKQLNKELKDEDIEIVAEMDMAEPLKINMDLIFQLALTGGLLAVIILWYFLHNLRLVLVIGLSMPVSILTSLNLFYAFDITLNSLTLVGMALAIGMLLDNSIVVLENIYRFLQKKKSASEAVIRGTKEIWRSIFAATFTTVAVFIPFLFASNFFVQIIGYNVGVSIISTLIVSLFVALLFIPMSTNFLLERKSLNVQPFYSLTQSNRLMQIYTLLLKSAIRFPLRTIGITLVLFFMSIFLAFALSINVSSEVELEDFELYVTMAAGATLETTDIAVAELEDRLKSLEEIEDIISQIYEEEAVLTLKLKENFNEINQHTVADVKNEINNSVEDFTAADVSFEKLESSARFGGGFSNRQGARLENLLGIGRPVERVVVKGHDFELMQRVADDINYQIDELSSIDWARINLSQSRPEIDLLFDKTLLNQYNIALNSIMNELSTFQGEVNSSIKFKEGTEEYDIIIRNDDYEERKLGDLKNLDIPSQTGAIYDLDQISSIIHTYGNSTIRRYNQERQIEIEYKFEDEINESTTMLESSRQEIQNLVFSLEIPAGIAIEIIHDETDLSDFYFLLGLTFILIYMILASVFESLLNPVVIMFTIPLAAIGSLWAIIFTGNSLLNANTLIGFLILFGIVVNNGIILIDYTRLLKQRGFRTQRALIVAGQARLRPILITAITTIAAMVPLAMGKEEYVTKIAAPFAITVIGGLTLSTVFTLVLIPTVYSGLESIIVWLKQLNWKLKLLQVVLLLVGSALIYFKVESILWQFVLLFLILFLIPGITYFTLNSLRQAKAEFIKPDESITIYIRNLFKNYDQASRFVREWKKKERIQNGKEKEDTLKNWKEFLQFSWQYILLAFLIYFVYFYLDTGFWIFVLSHIIYFYGFYILKHLQSIFSENIRLSKKSILFKIITNLQSIYIWIIPVINLIVFYIKWEEPVLILFIGFVWYFALSVYSTSNRLLHNLVDINRLKGRFAGIRKRFYKLIQIIPIIGKKKIPFRALENVTLEIGRGMFGLLGPNGAGKTTLMRTICGILEQSYGSIRFNNIDAKEKREELQGLIGYLPQEFGTYENMTADEFLKYQAILKGIYDKDEREQRVKYVISSVHLDDTRYQKIGSFSGGMKQRVGIAQTLLHLPRILVVDEPTAGLDPRERIRFRNLLVELSRERIVIFSTHIIEDVASSCDKVAILNRGNLKYLGKPKDMVKQAEGKVWQVLIEENQFNQIREGIKVVHHLRVGEKIRARCLTKDKPMDEAIQVKPSLEDAYLWLLEGNNV